MLTNCLAACAHLTITVSEIERDIGRKSSFFHTPLHLTPSLGGSRRNIATPFGIGETRMVWLPMVKKFRRYVYSFWHYPRTWQTARRTDGRTPHADIGRSYASHRAAKTPSAIFKIVFRHILFCFVSLMQFGLWRPAAFVSSPIHLFRYVSSSTCWQIDRQTDRQTDGQTYRWTDGHADVHKSYLNSRAFTA